MNNNFQQKKGLLEMIQRADSGWLRLLIVFAFVILGALVFYFGYILTIKGVHGEFKILSDFKGWTLYITSISPGIIFVLAGTLIMCWGLPKTIQRLHR